MQSSSGSGGFVVVPSGKPLPGQQQQNSSSSGTGGANSGETSPKSGSSWGATFSRAYYNTKNAAAAAIRKKPEIDSTNSIHCLGACGNGQDWLLQQVKAIPYFSYRDKLPQTIGSGLDHDAGWGCMVRTGQMMTCTALYRAIHIIHNPDDFSNKPRAQNKNISTAAFHEGENEHQYDSSSVVTSATSSSQKAGGVVDVSAQRRVITSMFRDVPGCDFSIYAIVAAGSKYHIAPGEWFNATSLALSLKSIISSKSNEMPIACVHGKESTVELLDIENAMIKEPGKPILVMISVMLGMNNISSGYFKAVHEAIGHPNSVGIVGGKPKKSMYFFASQKEQLFMLDPHFVQHAFVDEKTRGTQADLSVGMDWVKMEEADSSMLLCFLLKSDEDHVMEWVNWVDKSLPPLSEYPIFVVSRRKCCLGTNAFASKRPPPNSSSPTSAAGTSLSSLAVKAHNQQNPPPPPPAHTSQQKEDDDDGFECISTEDWANDDMNEVGTPPPAKQKSSPQTQPIQQPQQQQTQQQPQPQQQQQQQPTVVAQPQPITSGGIHFDDDSDDLLNSNSDDLLNLSDDEGSGGNNNNNNNVKKTAIGGSKAQDDEDPLNFTLSTPSTGTGNDDPNVIPECFQDL